MITCKFENGNKVSLRHVTVNAILVKGNKVLLGKRGLFQGKKIAEAGKWGLIGGYLDRDENIEQGLKREVREESGWEINNLQLFRINDNPNRPGEDKQNIDIAFLAKAVKRKSLKISEEVTELKWFDLNRLPSKEKIAFDHGENLMLYKKYLEKKFTLPIWGKIEKL
ncbi:NUDIX hydrolase [Patescibacteria group bacterium]